MGAQQADLIFSDSQYGTQVWGTKCPLIVKICGLCFGAGTKLRTVSTCTQIAYYRKRGHFVPLRSILVLNSYVVVPQFWIMYDCVKIRGQTVPLGYILYTKVS